MKKTSSLRYTPSLPIAHCLLAITLPLHRYEMAGSKMRFELPIANYLLLIACCLLPIASLFSQAPQGLNYQAVVRDVDGDILAHQQVNFHFTITNGDAGSVVYQETQATNTNQFGLVALQVGKGVPASGSFAAIDWALLTPWLAVGLDIDGGSSFVDMGSTPLLSVPYALYAANSGGESVWDVNGSNIFFDNHVGIGTDNPSSPLSVQTGINEVGFSHTTAENPITLATSISDVAASIGTSSDNVFSLNAGGVGKVHVWPDGRVVIGDDMDPTDLTGTDDNSGRTTPIIAKLTLETPVNSTGFMHIGGADEIILRQGIGSVSASIGTETSHTFRLASSGLGRIHIEPNGQVIIGTNLQPPVGQFTVYTPNNTNGLTQVGGDGQILSTRIGGSSAGIGTFTNHIMRIFSNGLARINIDGNGNVAIGTPDPLPGYLLSVNGNMKAKELVIETIGWPDYVFADQYALLSLPETEAFIQQYKHLPNMPSAMEIERDGVAVGDMQKKMMEKIEELTLHMIRQEKVIEQLQSKIDEITK